MKDLGPRARAQVEAVLAETPKRKRDRREVRGEACPYRCECGHEFPDWPVTERHMQSDGCRRAGIDLEGMHHGHR